MRRRWPRHRFELDVAADGRAALARAWLLLALAALAMSGVYAVLLVVARTPALQAWLPMADFFHVALVVHVDLSVLVWFGAMAGMLWTLASPHRTPYLGWLAFAAAGAGAAAMMAAPFVQPGAAVMANYVPVLASPVFLGGLALFGLGLAGAALHALAGPWRLGSTLVGAAALRFGLACAAASLLLALLALLTALWALGAPPRVEAALKPYYEALFWGFGHAVQFTWTLLMLVCWLLLSTRIGAAPALSPRVAVLLFGIALAATLTTPAIQLAHAVGTVEQMRLFTWQMRFGGGLAILPFVLALGMALRGAPALDAQARPLRAALLSSMVLFCVGGSIGFLIRGNDVRIPAHYHGSIVGVTLALMGACYALLPVLGVGAARTRLAHAQPLIYGGGQLLHIVGLTWSGGYGVQRKVAGAAQVLRSPEELAAMGLMGAGGLTAIVGGLLFAVVVLRAWRQTDAEAAGPSGPTMRG